MTDSEPYSSYDPRFNVDMADVAVAFRDLPADHYLTRDLYSLYFDAAYRAGRVACSFSQFNRLLTWIGSSGRGRRGRWIDPKSLAEGFPRLPWTDDSEFVDTEEMNWRV